MSVTFLNTPSDVRACPSERQELIASRPDSEQKNHSLKILLQPFKLNTVLTLKNRCVMAPMTRCFAIDGEPTESMAAYYGKRNGFGLIISEATMIDKEASGYPNTPGIFSESQVSKWKLICDKVHENGSKFFIQLWHAGMMSHKVYRNGKQPIAASDVLQTDGFIPRTNKTLRYLAPKPIDKQDREEIKKSFRESALNAMKAGFDGIELHAANGYLLDSFLHYYSNTRTDEYGGSPKNMSRFILEIIDELIIEIGSERIGIRLSPLPVVGMNNMKEDVRDQEVFVYLLAELKKRNIAYLHVSTDNDREDSGKLGMPVSRFLKKHFDRAVIGCGGYSIEAGAEAINEKKFELIAFGRLAIANPNLVELIKNHQESSIRNFEPKMLQELT